MKIQTVLMWVSVVLVVLFFVLNTVPMASTAFVNVLFARVAVRTGWLILGSLLVGVIIGVLFGMSIKRKPPKNNA